MNNIRTRRTVFPQVDWDGSHCAADRLLRRRCTPKNKKDEKRGRGWLRTSRERHQASARTPGTRRPADWPCATPPSPSRLARHPSPTDSPGTRRPADSPGTVAQPTRQAPVAQPTRQAPVAQPARSGSRRPAGASGPHSAPNSSEHRPAGPSGWRPEYRPVRPSRWRTDRRPDGGQQFGRQGGGQTGGQQFGRQGGGQAGGRQGQTQVTRFFPTAGRRPSVQRTAEWSARIRVVESAKCTRREGGDHASAGRCPACLR